MTSPRASPSAPADPTATDRLLAHVETLRRRNPQRAWSLLQREFPRAVRGAEQAKRGELWRLRAHVLRGLRRARAAVDAYHRAEHWFARSGRIREQGRCAIGLVDAWMYLGRYDEASRAARRGRRSLERAGDRVSLARLLNNEANIFHRLDLPERALARYREARRALKRAGDAYGAAMMAMNLGNCFSLLGRLVQARRHYLEAERAATAAGSELDAVRARYNLAYLDFLDYRYESALQKLSRVGEEARRRGYPSIAALATLDRAEILLRLGSSGETLAEAHQASQDCARLGLGYERAKAETFAALAEFRLGYSAAARDRLERGLGAFHAEGNRVWIGETLVGLATVWWRGRSPRAAAALLSTARVQFSRAGDIERQGCALALLARAQTEYGERAAARATLATLRRLSKGRASPRLTHLRLAAEAALARSQGDRARAKRCLVRAARESERLAARILDEHWRSSFWAEWGWPHPDLAMLELEQGRLVEAFEALETGRGRSLMGPTTGRKAARRPGLPVSARRWASGRLARENQRMSRSVPETRPRGLPPHLEARAPAATKVTVRALAVRPPRTIHAKAIQSLLHPDSLLIDYILHQGFLSAITVSRAGLEGYRSLVAEAPLSQLVHSILFMLRSAAFAPPGARPVDPALDHNLSRLAGLILWPAVVSPGRGAAWPRALTPVPTGPLVGIPWAALPLPDGRALCQVSDTVIVPGLRLGLAHARAAPRAATGRPLVVAAGDRLENVEAETRAVLDAFPDAQVLSDSRATARRFLELAPRAPWIHFAGHGCYRAASPGESGLGFGDRWLTADELGDLRLSARWVTLSACQTARASVRPGEEWFGLARALLLCGAGAVVASQWDVEDVAAVRLMADMYARLAAGDPLGTALAWAQARRREDRAHPFDWAGFVTLGGPLRRIYAPWPNRRHMSGKERP